jgi:hypothetical protein
MTRSILKTTAIAATIAVGALAPLLAGTKAEAGHGKDFYSKEYTFDKPMNGYQGFSGAYYCSYVKQPKDVCTPNGQCKRIWTLVQSCQ